MTDGIWMEFKLSIIEPGIVYENLLIIPLFPLLWDNLTLNLWTIF